MSAYRTEGVAVWGVREDGTQWLECMAASPQGAQRISDALNLATPIDDVRRELIEQVEGKRDSLLCDCADSDDEPTNPYTGKRMDHHCDCQAVRASALLRGDGSRTVHAGQCMCGGPVIS